MNREYVSLLYNNISLSMSFCLCRADGRHAYAVYGSFRGQGTAKIGIKSENRTSGGLIFPKCGGTAECGGLTFPFSRLPHPRE